MVYGYIRYSTDNQDEVQQKFSLDEYASQRGLKIDAFEKDEGISGGVSYKDRKLYKLIKRLQPGDTLLVSEISRLGRSMSDLNKLVNDELVPRKIRLIVVKMGLDLNCEKISAVDQMVLYAFGFAAQLEKELIVQRTQSALDARKELIKKDGGFVSKSGNFVTHLGSQKGADMTPAHDVAAANKRAAAKEWRKTSALFALVKRLTKRGWTNGEILEECLAMYEVNPTVYCTRQGKAPSSGTISKMMSEILPMKIRRRHGSCKEQK